jgi:hypothetical protein
VPYGADQTVYLVVDRFSGLGTVYRETEVERTDLETAITDLIALQFNDPIRVVAFNTLEHWAQDVSKISPSKSRADATSTVTTFRMRCKTSSTATPVRIASLRCGWHTHEQPARRPIPQIGPRRAGQRDGSTASSDRGRS